MSGSGPVITRSATGPAAARLRAVAERLARAAHPGVVQLVSSAGSDDRWEVQLVHAGRPVELLAPLPSTQVAGLAAAVAATLADLHATGVVHGHLDGSHVLVSADGRPVLCGFGADDGGAAPPDDVAALGALIVRLLGPDPEGEVVPERRWGRRGADWARRSLLLLADHACAEPASRRPTASRLAASIASTIPGAPPVATRGEVVGEPGVAADPLDALRATSATPRDRSPGRPLAAAVVAALTLGGIVFAAGVLRSPVTTATRPAPPPSDTPPTTAPATTGPPARPPAPCPVEGDLGAPVGCGPVVVEGIVATVGPHRFEVGQPGDRVVVGDWDCDGVVTAAALRPSTGEVFVFPGWTNGPDVVVRPAARVADAVDLVAAAPVDRRGEPCPSLVVRLRDGSLEPVVLRGAA